jgi:hypothetical protein
MLEGKLARIRELLDTKEKVDAELEQLISGTDIKRGRPRKKTDPQDGGSESGGEA